MFPIYDSQLSLIGPDKWSELAQDRCGWKKIVVACYAADIIMKMMMILSLTTSNISLFKMHRVRKTQVLLLVNWFDLDSKRFFPLQ